MNLVDSFADVSRFVRLRRDIHAHPELGFEEHRTSKMVAELLREWGIEVHTGIAGTGVVGVLRCGNGQRSIGLRADMDALPLQEENRVPAPLHARWPHARLRARRPHHDAAGGRLAPGARRATSTAR